MIAYFDSSFVISLFSKGGLYKELKKIESASTSRIMVVECFRTFDRLVRENKMTESTGVKAKSELYQFCNRLEILRLTESVLERASTNFGLTIGTLDSIHLSSCLEWRERKGVDPAFFTHDKQLGKVARAQGLHVIGC